MRFPYRLLLITLLLSVGWFVTQCGSVTISDLDPEDFSTPTPVATP